MTYTRADVVQEARSWINTPYIRQGMIKDVGVDCALLVYAVYKRFGILPETVVQWFPDDWWCNTTVEAYLLRVEKYLKRVLLAQARRDMKAELLPGNLLLTRVCKSKVFNHAGIITKWPHLVHASPDGVREIDAASDVMWGAKDIVVFDIGLQS